MPSDEAPRSRWSWLSSQGLGLVLGQATVVLLGIGTLVISATRETASAQVQLDELSGFFSPPRWAHLWLYALLPVCALYALNTTLCTWQSVVGRWRRGTREVAAWAPSVIHLAFLFALLAHLVGGFFNREGESLTLTRSFSPLGDGRKARLVKLETETTPSKKLKAVHATVELEDASGRTEQAVLGYNEPISRGLGSELLLVSQAGQLTGAAFSLNGQQCRASAPGECWLGDTRVGLVALRQTSHWGARQVAVLAVEEPGTPPQSFPLAEGASHPLGGGASLRFDGVTVEDAVEVRRRLSPGHPIALLSALVLVVGLSMMGRRWLRAPTPEDR